MFYCTAANLLEALSDHFVADRCRFLGKITVHGFHFVGLAAHGVIEQYEISSCVQLYVAKLSDPYRAVLLLHDADGLTVEEIANLLQLPLTTVKMRLHRARRRLQAALDEACAFGRDERGVYICEPKPKKP